MKRIRGVDYSKEMKGEEGEVEEVPEEEVQVVVNRKEVRAVLVKEGAVDQRETIMVKVAVGILVQKEVVLGVQRGILDQRARDILVQRARDILVQRARDILDQRARDILD
jgi:hypothetical protein